MCEESSLLRKISDKVRKMVLSQFEGKKMSEKQKMDICGLVFDSIDYYKVG